MMQLTFKIDVYKPNGIYQRISSETKVVVNERDDRAVSETVCGVLNGYITQEQMRIIVNTVLREIATTRLGIKNKEIFYNADDNRSIGISVKRAN